MARMDDGGGAPKPAQRPTRPHGTYTVKAGDTLWGIARQHLGAGERYGELARASGIKDPNMIRPGQQIVIPQERMSVRGRGETGYAKPQASAVRTSGGTRYLTSGEARRFNEGRPVDRYRPA